MQVNDWDIVITGGTLLTMSEKMEVIENPFIGIKDGKIITVSVTHPQADPGRGAKDEIDASSCIIMPGLVNTHTHLPMVCFRGLADDLPLMEWLYKHIFPAEARFAGKKMVYDGALLAMAEMILSGTTTFCDGYFFESEVGKAALQSGMRAVIAQGFIDFPAPDDPAAAKKAAVARRFAAKWNGVSALITPAFFCHSPYTCSPETLTAIKEEAVRADIPFLIHLLENKDEIATITERYGRKPVQHLQELGVLDEKTIAVHCNWLTEEDMAIFAHLGVKVSHNPESSMKLAAGVAPIPQMLSRGITCGLGTDGCASNNDLDMFGEMDTAAKIHKVTTLNPTVMNAETVLKMATGGGAHVLGLASRIGSIEVGKEADIILVDMNKPHLTPIYDCCSHLVYAACGADTRTSIIDGKIVMRDRRLLTIDVDKAMENVRRLAATVSAERS
jgi:5-methylthioadenosine/S-adenosylhomocysteine deaminase